jgi:Pentapeptide repeats (9 copies)
MAYTAYVLGREVVPLEPPYGGRDYVFAAARLDGESMQGVAFQHCTFANVSFKEATLNELKFDNCVFIGCYFRRANLTNAFFAGCRFIDCAFPRMAIRGCDFRYCSFSNCFIPFSEMQLSLPKEPNLRQDIARNLAIEAGRLGYPDDARLYRMCAIASREQDLKFAMTGATEWYRQHYDAIRRIAAFFGFVGSVLNRWLWGYGENAWVLIRNYLCLAMLIFPVLYYGMRAQLGTTLPSNIRFVDVFLFSLENIMSPGVHSGVFPNSTLMRICAGTESLLGVVIAGLFISYLFAWVSEK